MLSISYWSRQPMITAEFPEDSESGIGVLLSNTESLFCHTLSMAF